MNKTIIYYNENCQELLKRYDSANMKQLNKIIDKFILKDNFVLDLGFGSGRDLNYIKNITNNIYGLDASIEFVNNLKQNEFYKNKVSLSTLPEINTISFDRNKFDIIISIAVFMHLKKNDIIQTIRNIKKNLVNNGKVIISYTTKSRDNDKRDFLEITKNEMTILFNSENFREVESIVNNDSLNRKIEWITQVYEL
ncbi:MAG: class I SAM-dependent methyltransferase [Arcobacteraceae bacterium]|nr:class I SAM-dependent methyltransferase [Arcobacteraceae bacterium]